MNQEQKDEIVYLYLDDIIPNRFQPREVFDERALKELAVSIKEHGVIQPIIVRNVNGKYEIIAGERRYKASAMAGLTKIPAIIRNLDDKESSKVALLENLQRRNLNPIEEARTYQKILEIDQMTQEELAKTMGKSQSAVANKIRLLGLSDEVQTALLKEQISERHARTLLNIPDKKKQNEMLKRVINEKMTVRQLEQEIKDMYPKEKGESMNNQAMNMSSSPITSTSFVNSSPLIPTAALPEDTSDYGKIRIAPPDGENTEEHTPRFINYGEIKDDDDDDDQDNNPIGGFNPNSSQQLPNINEIKANAIDINAPSSKPSADLDSLLHLNSAPIPTSQNPEHENFRFITPAEEIVKTDENKENQVKNEDYFKTPDLIPVDLPSEVQTKNTNTVSLDEIEGNPLLSLTKSNVSPDSRREKPNQAMNTNSNLNTTLFGEVKRPEPKSKKNEQFTVQKSIDMVRSLVDELNRHGVKADIDEMNFAKSYQIIIKLDKTAE